MGILAGLAVKDYAAWVVLYGTLRLERDRSMEVDSVASIWASLTTAVAWVAGVVGGIGSLLLAIITYFGLSEEQRKTFRDWYTCLLRRSLRLPPRGPSRVIAVALGVSILLGASSAVVIVKRSTLSPNPPKSITVLGRYSLMSSSSEPQGITVGPDRSVWFTERYANKIGRVTPRGVPVEFDVKSQDSGLDNITVGPDGALWFTEGHVDRIGRVTTAGQVEEFGSLAPLSQPAGIVAGPDGNIWFTEYHNAKIGVMTPAGALLREIPLTPGSQPDGITVGPDHNLWFVESKGSTVTGVAMVGRLAPTSNQPDLISVPTPKSRPTHIIVGPDHNLWFTEQDRGRIGRVSSTMTGGVTEFRTSSQDTGPRGIAIGPDGNLWFAESDAGRLARIDPGTGQIKEFTFGAGGGIRPLDVVEGGDGHLWVTEMIHGKIYQIRTENAA
jgi:streptogramin lyase